MPVPFPSPALSGAVGPTAPVLRSKALVVASASLGTFVVLLLTSGLNIMAPSMTTELQMSDTALSFVLSGYTLAFAMLSLPGGALADRFGAHRIFAIGLIVFAVASVIASTAPTVAWVIVGTFGEGAGAALVLPAALSVIEFVYRDEPARLGAMIGIWAGANALGAALGPVVSGAIVTTSSWRAVFVVVAVVGAAVAALGQVMFPRMPPAQRGIDVPGMFIIIALLGVIVLTAHWAPHLAWWQISVAVVVALGFCWTFRIAESRAAEPMVPLAQLRDVAFSANAVVTVVGTAAFFGPLYIISIGLQEQLGMTPLTAGVALLPLAAGNIVAALAAGHVQRWIGIRGTMIAGSALVAASIIPIPFLFTQYSSIVALFVVLGIGWGLLVPSTSAAGLTRAHPGKEGVASGVTSGGRELGAALAAVVLLPLGMTTGLLGSALVGVISLSIVILFVRPLGAPDTGSTST